MKHRLFALLAFLLAWAILVLPAAATAETAPQDSQAAQSTEPLDLTTPETIVPVLVCFALALLCIGFGLWRMLKRRKRT